jgi:hypothetical protein
VYGVRDGEGNELAVKVTPTTVQKALYPDEPDMELAMACKGASNELAHENLAAAHDVIEMDRFTYVIMPKYACDLMTVANTYIMEHGTGLPEDAVRYIYIYIYIWHVRVNRGLLALQGRPQGHVL